MLVTNQLLDKHGFNHPNIPPIEGIQDKYPAFINELDENGQNYPVVVVYWTDEIPAYSYRGKPLKVWCLKDLVCLAELGLYVDIDKFSALLNDCMELEKDMAQYYYSRYLH